eukprot:14670411-Alexandrium_andersonii.AAC.1
MLLPVPDESRSVPANFDSSVREAFVRSPSQVLPKGPSAGKYSVAIHDDEGACIDIQMQNKLFYIKKKTGN